MGYHLEEYWSDVAKRIGARPELDFLAGDNDPFYAYKRERFLKHLLDIDMTGRTVLEVGCGPGGNLREILQKHTVSELHGADISQDMIQIAGSHLGADVALTKTDGRHLPYSDDYFDVIYTSTVLQHVIEDDMVIDLIGEMCRVSRGKVYLFERTEPKRVTQESNVGRMPRFYEDHFGAKGFYLNSKEFLNITSSYYVCGVIRKLLSDSSRGEGEQISGISAKVQKVLLPMLKRLDGWVPAWRGLTIMEFNQQTPHS